MWSGNRHLDEVLASDFLVVLEMGYLAFFIVAALQSYQMEGKWVDSIVKLASAMTLECVFPKAGTVNQMFWQKEESKEKIAVFKLPDQLNISSRYKDRVSVTNNTSKIKSLVFNSTGGEDTGFYLCLFQTFPYGNWKKRIQVVQPGDFEPRNLPYRHVVAESGANVSFTCRPDPKTTFYQVKWKRIHADRIDYIAQCDESGTIYGSDYEDRVVINCASQEARTITLWNVTASDSGMYSCSYIGMNGINSAIWTKLTIDGNISLESHSDQRIFVIAGAAAVLSLILILIITALICHHKKKKKKKKMMMMKAFRLAHTQANPSNKYGRPDCQNAVNTIRGQITEDAVYANCTACSHRQNM